MNKLTEFRDKIDGQESRVDSWFDRLRDSPHTARLVIAIALIMLLAGLALWIR